VPDTSTAPVRRRHCRGGVAPTKIWSKTPDEGSTMSANGGIGCSKPECPQRNSERLAFAVDQFTGSGHCGTCWPITPMWMGGTDLCWQSSK
jgi:hypothetical protein